jgi:hypothetical protein
MKQLPIACSLTPEQTASNRAQLLPGLVARARSRENVSGGFRWQFAAAPGLLADMARVIESERECCPFLGFEIAAEPDGGVITLTVTGPKGTTSFLASLIASGDSRD